jgi:hypothetical protein
MARKAKTAAREAHGARFDAAEFNRALDDAQRQQTDAAGDSGHVGKITQSACERLGVSREAFSSTRRLDRKDPAKRDALIRDHIRCWRARGFFAQIDAFEDIADELVDILRGDKDSSQREASSAGGALDAVLN